MGFDLQAHQELKRLSYQVNCLVRDFCCRAKRCFGISENGKPNLVLNQQGDWSPLRNISQYAALVSKIDFTNNGGDNYSVDFFIDPISSQLPTGVTVDAYDYDIVFWVGGVTTHLETGNKATDYSFNTTGNGAGVYQLKQNYVLSNGKTLGISSLILVDNTGTILQRIDNNGYTVNSVIGLDINITINLTLFNYSADRVFLTFDGIAPTSITNIGLVNTGTVTTHAGDIMILGSVILDSSWNDFTGDFFSNLSFLIV